MSGGRESKKLWTRRTIYDSDRMSRSASVRTNVDRCGNKLCQKKFNVDTLL